MSDKDIDQHGVYRSIEASMMRKDLQRLLDGEEVVAATDDIDGWLERFQVATGYSAHADEIPRKPFQLMRAYRILL